MTGSGSLFAGRPERSRRRRTPLRRFLYRALAPPMEFAARALWRTCRVVAREGEEHWARTLGGAGPCVPCFWHEHLLLCILRLQHDPTRRARVAYLVSPSIDGDLFTLALERRGARVVRGSSTRSGLRAMRGLHRVTAKEGFSPVITPDGPTGPARSAKAGVLMLSQLARVPVVPMSVASAWSWRAPSWDRLVVPLPFARIAFATGEPLLVPRGAGDAGLEDARRELERRLEDAQARARAALG